MKKISVSVPSYNRPDTIKQLIISFLNQDYPNKELIITDDSPNDSIQQVVKEFNDKQIKYIKNPSQFGFAKNLLESVLQATGDFVFIAGDDDILFTKSTLSRYVEIFIKNPKVHYVYCNFIQFSKDNNIDYVLNTFPKSEYVAKGEEGMKKMWLTSLFIGGMGFRNNIDFKKFYPKKNVLYPQVELVGHILNNYDSYSLAEYHLAARSHEDQIIFHAIKDKKVRGEGKHTNLEFIEIFSTIKKTYNITMSDDFLMNYLINLHTKIIFKEKMFVGNALLSENYYAFCNVSPQAKASKKLFIAYIMALILPAPLVALMRSSLIKLAGINKQEEFATYKDRLIQMTKL